MELVREMAEERVRNGSEGGMWIGSVSSHKMYYV
jgi:hypothetical protein